MEILMELNRNTYLFIYFKTNNLSIALIFD